MPIYSQELRDRVIDHLEMGEHSQAETADLFSVSLSTLEKWWRQWRQTQQCVARPRGKPQRALAACEVVIRARVAAEPDVSLEALRAHVQAETGVVASQSMMCRTLQVLRLPRKKKASMIVNATRRACKRCGRPLPPRNDPRGANNAIA